MKQTAAFLILLLFCLPCFSQNPFKYESKVITVTSHRPNGHNGPIVTAVNLGGFAFPTSYRGNASAFDVNGTVKETLNTSIHGALELIHKNMNSNGYSLKSSVGNVEISGLGCVTLFFEKSDSYREQELYKLIREITTDIDSTSKRFVDSAMVNINLSVLNYLRQIPHEVLTSAYRDQMREAILTQVRKEYDAVIEELRSQIRRISN